MAGYRLELARSAAKEIDGVEPMTVRRRIVARIRALAAEPRSHGSEKLAGAESLHRVRQGAYRVVYEIDDRTRIVRIVRVAHRREGYR